MAEICISVVAKLAEYTVAPVLRPFGYLINYKSNVEDLTEKVRTLTAKRDGVQQRVDAAKRNLEGICPEVELWLERVDQTIQEKETCFEEGRVAEATTCCSSNGWCPNLKVRHSLSRTATRMVPRVDDLIADGNFTAISCPPPPRKMDYPAIQYFEGASSSSGTSNPAKPPAPMDLSERLQYRLPYTKDLLTALQDDKISIIGISGTIREIDTVTTKEFMKRMKQKMLFEEVAMAVVSQDPDLKRIQGEIAKMLDLKLENGSLVERAERLRAVLLASDSRRILVILTDVCEILDLEAIGISRVDIKKSCKILLISQLSNVFDEMGTRSNFELLSQSTPVARPVEFESRISVIRDVMDALTDDESNPIVICGMGGIGKTTLVMEIGAKASEVDLFDDVAIAEFTQEPDLTKIQEKIAKSLGLKLEAEDDRAAKLRERLSMGTKKVLVILDNVWTHLDLWEIGIPISRDPKSCKLLISSRDQVLFKEMKTKRNFRLDGLPKHDAWSLFKEVAGGSIESDHELRPIAEQVLDECGGLPVAISTVGRALQDESISTWRNALRQLKQACPEDVPGVIKDVYGKIELSYESLPSEQAKSCFLLCCLFPESADIPTQILVMFGLGLGIFKGIDSLSQASDCVKRLLDTLRNRSLLLDGDEKSHFKMHDVVRDVAVYIGSEGLRQNKNDQLERSVVLRQGVELNHWRKNCGIEESTYCSSLTTNMSTTELLLLVTKDKSKLELPATIFDGMEDLKVLAIASSILPSLSPLKNLQTLILQDCCLNIDVIGELWRLMILNLSESNVKQLPDTFKNLSNLRLLDLSSCTKLKVISPGVLSSLSRLEELYIWNSFEDWVVEKLGSTETIRWISQLEVDAQPEEEPEESEESEVDAQPIDVDIWRTFYKLAVEKLASTETTTDLISRLEEGEEEVMDDGDEDAESSESEELDSLGDMFAEYVEDEGNYDHLTRWANFMDWRVGLLAELLSLSCLTTLEVVLPPVVILRTSKLFHKLERFKINIGWEDHEDLEGLEGNYLRVHDLEASSLADTGISLLLKKTKKLELKLKNLIDPLNVLDVNCCADLESLILDKCDSLEYLIDMTVKQDTPRSVFPVLRYLDIDGARRLKEIFHGDLPLGSLQKLENLYLWNLPALTTICTIENQSRWLGNLAVVGRSIDIRDCQSLEAIFALEGSGHHVKEINFLSLTKLELKGLPSFTFQSLDLTCCANLESLTLKDCDSLEYLIDMTLKQDTPRSVFPVLNYLEIDGAIRLKEIFHGDLPLGSLQKLERLTLRDCQSLEAIFALEGSGHHVKEINFRSLTRLKLVGLPSFTGMSKITCKGLGRQLEVSSLYPDSLTVEHSLFSDPKVVFPILEYLDISRLGNLKEIWNNQLSPNSFSELRRLTVENCDKLLRLGPTQMQNRLQRMETIQVINCSSLEEIFEVGRLTVNEGNASISQSDKIPSNISLPDQGMQINDIMDFKQPCQGFQNLTSLHVSSCGSLRYLITPSIVKGLVKLESLKIKHCPKIEAIVAADEGEETEDESMLPELHILKLKNLPNLGSFSQGKYTFDWPLVQRIDINKCNKMNNFCSGSLSIRRVVSIYVSDSSKNLEQELNDSKKES